MGKPYECVFRVNDRRCSALTTKVCGRCSFFKTADELKEGREKAKERLKSLPKKMQMQINDKYFTGGEDDE